MITDVGIANAALRRIKIARKIASLDENHPDARDIKAIFAEVRERVLEDYDWPFARLRVQLVDLGDPPEPWAYRYRVPVDVLTPRYIEDGLVERAPDTAIPFEVRQDGASTGQVLLCDQPSAVLVYTALVTSPALFSRRFADAFAWALAAELALPKTGKQDVFENAQRGYMGSLAVARLAAREATRRGPPPRCEFVRARGNTAVAGRPGSSMADVYVDGRTFS